jgi:Na+/proline symporter
MFGFHVADFIVLILYFIGITGIGIWSAKKVKTVGDYFMPRSFGKSALIMHAFGTGTHSDQAVGVASKTFSSGLSAILLVDCTSTSPISSHHNGRCICCSI